MSVCLLLHSMDAFCAADSGLSRREAAELQSTVLETKTVVHEIKIEVKEVKVEVKEAKRAAVLAADMAGLAAECVLCLVQPAIVVVVVVWSTLISACVYAALASWCSPLSTLLHCCTLCRPATLHHPHQQHKQPLHQAAPAQHSAASVASNARVCRTRFVQVTLCFSLQWCWLTFNMLQVVANDFKDQRVRGSRGAARLC